MILKNRLLKLETTANASYVPPVFITILPHQEGQKEQHIAAAKKANPGALLFVIVYEAKPDNTAPEVRP